MTSILTYDFPLLSCDCLPCAQPISCTQTWWVPDTIDQCEPQALNHTKSAESAPPYRPNEQACSGTHRAKKIKNKNAWEEANPCTHGTRENTNKYTPSFRDHTLHNITYKYNYNCCCYSGSWRLCGGLEACCWSWAKLWGKHWCPREAMLTESRQCGSTLTQSPHTHIHTNTHSLKRMSNRHLALGMPWDITDKIGAYCSSEWHGQTILLHTAQQSHFKWSTSVGGSAL